MIVFPLDQTLQDIDQIALVETALDDIGIGPTRARARGPGRFQCGDQDDRELGPGGIAANALVIRDRSTGHIPHQRHRVEMTGAQPGQRIHAVDGDLDLETCPFQNVAEQRARGDGIFSHKNTFLRRLA